MVFRTFRRKSRKQKEQALFRINNDMKRAIPLRMNTMI